MLEHRINEFVKECLNNYAPGNQQSKFVHDPIWGTIEVKGYEAAILDSPLLQRLRHIHQTGFVFQTYPSARHSRFEHTLGVMHVAGRIAETLGKKYRDDDILPKTVQRVRLAAILHDTGHSAFSHTSEEVYSQCEDLLEFKTRNPKFANSGAGELLSYLIASSGAFGTFFSELKNKYTELAVDVDEFAILITGKPSDPKRFFEAEIISGAFDADKLDYFPRDGRAAGIQLALDTDRLLHCLEISDVKLDNGTSSRGLVVNRGGFNPLQQLLFARATLFATVYHHHKVRSCDSMVKGCFEYWTLSQTSVRKTQLDDGKLTLKSAADFLYINDQVFFAQAYIQPQDSFSAAQIRNLLGRQLSKRVLTVATRTITNLEDEDMTVGYQEFRDLHFNFEAARDLAKAICKRANYTNHHQVWLDIPHKPNLEKAGKALIRVSSDGAPIKTEELAKVIPVKQWVDTYNQYYSQSFVFGPHDCDSRIKLCLAALEEFRAMFGLKFKDDAIPADIRPSVLEALLLRNNTN